MEPMNTIRAVQCITGSGNSSHSDNSTILGRAIQRKAPDQHTSLPPFPIISHSTSASQRAARALQDMKMHPRLQHRPLGAKIYLLSKPWPGWAGLVPSYSGPRSCRAGAFGPKEYCKDFGFAGAENYGSTALPEGKIPRPVE